jgi:hypothetical protein
VAKTEKQRTMVVCFYFAHAHCCSKFITRHKAAVATVLEFIAKGKNNNKKIILEMYCVRGEFTIFLKMRFFFEKCI